MLNLIFEQLAQSRHCELILKVRVLKANSIYLPAGLLHVL